MTKRRKLVKLIQRHIDNQDVFVKVMDQLKPYTYVNIGTVLGGVPHSGTGFSKVMRPDKWDANKGLILARDKACINMADNIIAIGEEDRAIDGLESLNSIEVTEGTLVYSDVSA